jgi:acyl carrier protein
MTRPGSGGVSDRTGLGATGSIGLPNGSIGLPNERACERNRPAQRAAHQRRPRACRRPRTSHGPGHDRGRRPTQRRRPAERHRPAQRPAHSDEGGLPSGVGTANGRGSGGTTKAWTPETDTVASELIDLIATVSGHTRTEIGMDAGFTDDLGYDSIMMMQLGDQVAAHWAFHVPVQELVEDVVTVGDLVTFLHDRLDPVTSPSSLPPPPGVTTMNTYPSAAHHDY